MGVEPELAVAAAAGGATGAVITGAGAVTIGGRAVEVGGDTVTDGAGEWEAGLADAATGGVADGAGLGAVEVAEVVGLGLTAVGGAAE